MAHIEKSIFINASIEKVFDFIAEPNNLPKWDFMAVEVKERSIGPVGIGTTFIEVVKMPGGVKTNSPGRVIEYDRPHKLVWEFRSAGMLLTIAYRLEPEGSGTLVTGTADCMMPWGLLGKALDKLFMARYLAGNTERINADLKRVLENGQAGSSL
jgi:uncharacterized protein YndB with AHSA1/START domain